MAYTITLDRYTEGDILELPVSKLKHNGVVYKIVDEQARPEEITDLVSTSKIFNSSNKLKPNTDYTFAALTTLTFDSASVDSSPFGTTIKFNSGSTATTIIDSAGITWADGSVPIPSASKTCLILIWNKIGFYKEW